MGCGPGGAGHDGRVAEAPGGKAGSADERRTARSWSARRAGGSAALRAGGGGAGPGPGPGAGKCGAKRAPRGAGSSNVPGPARRDWRPRPGLVARGLRAAGAAEEPERRAVRGRAAAAARPSRAACEEKPSLY